MKKWFGLLLMLCMIMVVLALPAMAAENVASGTCGENLTWVLDSEGVLTISGTGDMIDFSDPAYIPWYNNKLDIKTIVIESGVSSIGDYAFYYCQDITSIDIPAGVTRIGIQAFGECTNLSSVNLSDGITNIAQTAFYNCTKLTSIVIPDSVVSMGSNVFYGCSSLESVYFNGNSYQFDIVSIFNESSSNLKIYYYEGSTGWDNISDSRLKSLPAPSQQSKYTAVLSVSPTTTTVNQQVKVTVGANTAFAASEITLTYDTTVLTFNKDTSTLNGTTFEDQNGTLTLTDYGEEQTAYILAFTAKAAAETEIKLISAAFSTAEDAATEDLTPAIIENGTVTVSVSMPDQSVTLPSIFIGNDSVAYGDPYTFSLPSDSKYFDYGIITATIGDIDAEVIDNEDGTYTVKNVTGALVITATRTPKSYDIKFQTTTGVELPTDARAVYSTDFIFDIPTQPFYTTGITRAYYESDNSSVPYSAANGRITIAGSKITGNIVIVIDQVRSQVTVSVEGNAASDAAGYSSEANVGEAYTLTVTQDSKYTYTVTASVNGQIVNLSASGNTYTVSADKITADSESIIFTVTKTLKTDHVTVSEYLTLNDGMKLWLIQVPGTKAEGMVYCYNNTPMFWSDAYTAYCTVVESVEKPTVNAENLTLVTGTAVVVNYGGDVNMSGSLDANDAQFVYNMYNTMYNGITNTVTVEKYLRADINHDGKITVLDATAIVSAIVGKNQ